MSKRPILIALCVVALSGPYAARAAHLDPTVIARIPASDSRGIDVNTTTNRVYVANFRNDFVSVFDGGSNALVTLIPTAGCVPARVAVNSLTNRVYVTCFGDGFIRTVKPTLVIDGATNLVIDRIFVGLGPEGGIAVNPVSNRVYVSKTFSRNVFVIDGATDAVIATIPLSDSPSQGLGVNLLTNRIYVAGGGSVFVIDGGTNAVIAAVPVTLGVHFDAGVNPVTNRVYVPTTFGSNNVTVIDGASNSVIAIIPLGVNADGLALNAVTNRIYVASRNTPVFIIDGASNTVTGTVSVGSFPVFVGINPLTDRVYVGHPLSGFVSVIADKVPFAAFDTTAEIELGALHAFQLNGTFTVGAESDGIDPPGETVTLRVGTFSTTIPPGSFARTNAGPFGEFEFEGVINGARLELRIRSLGGGAFEFQIEGEGASLAGTANPVTVDLLVGDDRGSATVIAEFN